MRTLEPRASRLRVALRERWYPTGHVRAEAVVGAADHGHGRRDNDARSCVSVRDFGAFVRRPEELRNRTSPCSAYGPNLVLFDCMDPSTPHFGEQCTIDVPGTLAHPRGVFGGAASVAAGPYFAGARVHTALLRDSILNPDQGAVEAWYRQKSDPKPFAHNPHRIIWWAVQPDWRR
jgi:hypothetical protein